MPNEALDDGATAVSYLNAAADGAAAMGAPGTAAALKSAAKIASAGVSAGVTTAGILVVASSGTVASAIGSGALAGLAGGPLAPFTVAIGAFIGAMIAIGQTFTAGTPFDPVTYNKRHAAARAAQLNALKTIAMLDRPENAAARKQLIATGWYQRCLDGVYDLNDADLGTPGAWDRWIADHHDPLENYPVPPATREAIRYAMAVNGEFVGTFDQVAAMKARLKAEAKGKTFSVAAKVTALGALDVHKYGHKYTTFFVLKPKFVDVKNGLRIGRKAAAALPTMSTAQLRAVAARPVAKKKPGVTIGEVVAGVVTGIAGYLIFL